MRALSTLALGLALLAAPQVRAAVDPTRSGESGFVEVPSAEAIPPGASLLGAELRLDRVSGQPSRFGPYPIYGTAGLLPRLELGFSMRQWGRPGDELPQRTAVGAAAKLQIIPPHDLVPGFAVDGTFDRMNIDGVAGARFIASLHAPKNEFALAAFLGGELGPKSGMTYGAAFSTILRPKLELVAEALGGPEGQNFGGALRWRAGPIVSLTTGINYLPGADGFRVSLGISFVPRSRARLEPGAAAPGAEAEPGARPEEQTVTAFREDRPHLRLRIRTSDPRHLGEPRRLQHGEYVATAAGPEKPSLATGARPVAPSLEQLAEAQIKEQEALADTRDRRVRGTAEQLDAREKTAQGDASKLGDREKELATREQQLDARAARIAPTKAPPTQQQRQLESLEAQLAAQERTLAAQERSVEPAVESASGREREAAAREDAERREASRLAASVSGAASRALQLEVRKQALAARNRELAAREARLVARGERIDAVERQLRTKAERLDTWSRRLDTRADRLDMLERRATETGAAVPAAGPRVTPSGAKEKSAFTMIVKSPTAIMKELAAAPAAGAAEAALHPGVAVEKAVAASTVLMFPTTATDVSELDREGIDSIAKLAAKEKCELLIWARAKDPSLMGEAQRRADDIRKRALAAGLDEKQVVIRITTRPGSQGVDVIVSALRESAKPAAAAPAATGKGLLSGESGKRQIREAVQAAQASIEACVSEVLSATTLARAEGTLKLSVSARGRVTKVVAGEGTLAGTQVEDCLNASAPKWLFPPAEAEYVVDVPITVIRGGAAK